MDLVATPGYTDLKLEINDTDEPNLVLKKNGKKVELCYDEVVALVSLLKMTRTYDEL